jgi:hypothetical protein
MRLIVPLSLLLPMAQSFVVQREAVSAASKLYMASPFDEWQQQTQRLAASFVAGTVLSAGLMLNTPTEVVAFDSAVLDTTSSLVVSVASPKAATPTKTTIPTKPADPYKQALDNAKFALEGARSAEKAAVASVKAAKQGLSLQKAELQKAEGTSQNAKKVFLDANDKLAKTPADRSTKEINAAKDKVGTYSIAGLKLFVIVLLGGKKEPTDCRASTKLILTLVLIFFEYQLPQRQLHKMPKKWSSRKSRNIRLHLKSTVLRKKSWKRFKKLRTDTKRS